MSGFYRTGKHVIVYSQNVKPCQYSISTLKGIGLLADDVIKSFAKDLLWSIQRTVPSFHTVHLNLQVN